MEKNKELTPMPKNVALKMIEKRSNILDFKDCLTRAKIDVEVYISYKFNTDFWDKVKDELLIIETYYNTKYNNQIK